MIDSALQKLFRPFVLYLMAAVMGLSACSTLSELLEEGGAIYEQAEVKRAFVDGLYGQVHIRIAQPIESEPLLYPPLILLPPAPYSSDYFKGFIPEMATDRLVIAIDTPGFGDSDRPPEPPSVADFADNMAMVLNGLYIDGPVDILGYHSGTLIGAEFAVQYPDRVRRLVLPGVPYFTGEEQAELYRENAKPDVLKEDGSHLESKWDFATGAIPYGMSLERAQEHFADAMQAVPESGYTYYGVFSYPGDKQLPKLKQPTLYITDSGSLRAATEAAHAVTTGSEIVYLDQYSKGIFDIGVKDIVRETRAFLDQD